MDQIAAGETSKDEVLQISREMLHCDHRRRSRTSSEDFAKQIWAGMDEDKFLGPCKVCEEAGRKHEDGSPNRLRIIDLQGRQADVRLRGLEPRRPRVARLLPGQRPAARPRLRALAARGALLGLRRAPRLTVKGFRGRPWKLCLNDDCPTMVEMREKRAERQAAKEAREAAKAAASRRRRRRRRRPPRPSRRRARSRRRRKRPATRRAKKPSPQTARAKQARSRSKQLTGRGVFITLEGIDRSGKTTQAALLAEALGPETLLLREPGAPRPASGSASC